ncbi:hypothetical protein JW859_01105 [bacterium]|nr:hypothetical protein [bacterium]
MRSITVLLAGLLACCLTATPAVRAAEPVDNFADLLDRHTRVMQPVVDCFNNNTVRIDYTEGDLETGDRITYYWQQGMYRKEFRWATFTEVFGYDGQTHWHGSDYNLPRLLDEGGTADLTAQLVGYFAYLLPGYAQYLGPAPAEVPLDLDERYAVLSFSPPGMCEALILLDPIDLRLVGMLQGNNHALANAVVFSLTLYDEWSDYSVTWYPAVIRLQRLSPGGELLRERLITTQDIQLIEPLPATRFHPSSSPQLPQPELPEVPFEIRFGYRSDTVIIPCKDADGRSLRLELDTGANVGLLRGDVARRHGLELMSGGKITGHGGSAEVQYLRMEGVQLVGRDHAKTVEIPAYPAAVLLENSALDDALGDKGVDGLLGNFLLHYFVVKIDFNRNLISLYPPSQFNPDEHLGKDYTAVPVVRDTMPYCEIVVDDVIKGGAFFNTGAQHFLTLNAWAIDDAGVTYDIPSFGTGITVHGETMFGIIHPGKVQLGDITIANPETNLEVLAPGEAPNRNQIGSFGNGFFEDYAVTFDLFNGYYYIEGVRRGTTSDLLSRQPNSVSIVEE